MIDKELNDLDSIVGGIKNNPFSEFELSKMISTNERWNELYNEWIVEYDERLKPTIDRISVLEPWSKDNFTLRSLDEYLRIRIQSNNLFEYSKKLIKDKNPEAETNLIEILEHKDNHFGVLMLLGNIYMETDRKSESVEYFTRARDLYKETMGLDLDFLTDRIAKLEGTYKQKKYYIPKVDKPDNNMVQLELFS